MQIDATSTSTMVREALGHAGFCWIRVRTDSMAPALRAGDEVRIEGLRRPPLPGEVLLYQGFRGLVLHRHLYTTLRRRSLWVRTKGDAVAGADALTPMKAVIGRATRLRRAGKERAIGRAGGTTAAALTSGRLFLRSAFRKALTPAIRTEFRTLAGFALELTLDRAFDSELLGIWLKPANLVAQGTKLRLRLDRKLHHDDPVAVRRDPATGGVGSSAFVLEPHDGGYLLRVAPAVGARSHPCPNALENGLRALLAELCARDGTVLMLHAAALALHDTSGAWIAPGASGTGKTTLCRLLQSEGALVLGDDLVLLRLGEDGPFVEGSPFSGDGIDIPKTPGRFPLHGWLVLEKAGYHDLQPAGPARVAASIGGALQGQGLESAEVLARATQLSGLTPGWHLKFARTPGLRQYMEQAFGDGNRIAH